MALAGHTHGGQVQIPGIGALVTFSNIPRDWASGFRKINNIYFNISAGIGVERIKNLLPIRFFTSPEITVITLNGK